MEINKLTSLTILMHTQLYVRLYLAVYKDMQYGIRGTYCNDGLEAEKHSAGVQDIGENISWLN